MHFVKFQTLKDQEIGLRLKNTVDDLNDNGYWLEICGGGWSLKQIDICILADWNSQ